MIAVKRIIQSCLLLLVLFFLMIEPVTGTGCNAHLPPKGTMVTRLGSVYCVHTLRLFDLIIVRAH